MAQWRGASAKPPFQGKFLAESTSNSTLQAWPWPKYFSAVVQFVNCRQRAPVRTPVRKEGQARNREIALEPAEILSTRCLRLVANCPATNTSTRSLVSPLRRCCRYSFARTAPDSPLTQRRSPPPLSTDVPFRAPLPALGRSRRPRPSLTRLATGPHRRRRRWHHRNLCLLGTPSI